MTELRATYRLQLGGDFGFAQARALVPYLAELGVSHLYLPPSFQARPGSTHGYDVVDPTRISEELGGEQEFRALVAAAREAGLGIVLDIVPNHMATDDANRYWSDPALREQFFDIDATTGRHRRFGLRWSLVLSTADPGAEPNSLEVAANEDLVVPSRSVILLRRR